MGNFLWTRSLSESSALPAQKDLYAVFQSCQKGRVQQPGSGVLHGDGVPWQVVETLGKVGGAGMGGRRDGEELLNERIGVGVIPSEGVGEKGGRRDVLRNQIEAL